MLGGSLEKGSDSDHNVRAISRRLRGLHLGVSFPLRCISSTSSYNLYCLDYVESLRIMISFAAGVAINRMVLQAVTVKSESEPRQVLTFTEASGFDVKML